MKSCRSARKNTVPDLQIRPHPALSYLRISPRFNFWYSALAWSTWLITGPASSAPSPTDLLNAKEDSVQSQWMIPQPAIASQPNSLFCRSPWQERREPEQRNPAIHAGSDAQLANCHWFYQLPDQKIFYSAGVRLTPSTRQIEPMPQVLKISPPLLFNSRPSKIEAISFTPKGSLTPSISLVKESVRSGNPPIQTGGFKANLVRSPSFYLASTLNSAPPFQSVPVLSRLSSIPPLKPTFHSSSWLLSQTEGNQPEVDPELGVLRIQEQPSPPPPNAGASPGQNQITQDPSTCDPELGCFPVKPWMPPPPPRPAFVYLLARVDYFRSSNVFSAVDPVDDGLFRPGLTLFAAPPLGPRTFLVASVNGNFIRYSTQSQIDYNELLADVGIFQQLSPVMFARLGWNYQQLFIYRDKILGLPAGTRFLSDHGIKLELSRRDRLMGKLSLNTFYQLRVGFAEPKDRSRILNSLIASLNYDIQPVLQVGLDYQFTLAHFTQQEREDAYHQIGIRLTYTMFRNTQLNLFAGYSFGRSSDPIVDFNGLVFGVSLGTSLPLF
ncbi:hypothetical protein K9N68_21165 [Kovacikia minuta CCNUW1]|uniref:hypothetical protein n=1 Tax=Kovacikia minuta TaxID=2931930 RepID=UPI001CCDD248|nr:hypothetical protein [Kovacikia minuta]UBF24215.1 hypothetical protein K9N68_21165 [Kovacikia minuta CCNUW1]